MASAIGGWGWEAPAPKGVPSSLFGDRGSSAGVGSRVGAVDPGASLWEMLRGPSQRGSASGSAAGSVGGGGFGGGLGGVLGRPGGGGDGDFLAGLVQSKQQRMSEQAPPQDDYYDFEGGGGARRYGASLFGPPAPNSPTASSRGFDFDRRLDFDRPADNLDGMGNWAANGEERDNNGMFEGGLGGAANGAPRPRDDAMLGGQSPFDTHLGNDRQQRRDIGRDIAMVNTAETTLRRLFERCDINGDGLVHAGQLFRLVRRDPEGSQLLGLTSLDSSGDSSFDELDSQTDRTLTWEDFLDVFLRRGISALTKASGSSLSGGESAGDPQHQRPSLGLLTVPQIVEELAARSPTRRDAAQGPSLDSRDDGEAAPRGRALSVVDGGLGASLAPRVVPTTGGRLASSGAASSSLVRQQAVPVAVISGASNVPAPVTRSARVLSPLREAASKQTLSPFRGTSPVTRARTLGAEGPRILSGSGIGALRPLETSGGISGMGASGFSLEKRVASERRISREEMVTTGRLMRSSDPADEFEAPVLHRPPARSASPLRGAASPPQPPPSSMLRAASPVRGMSPPPPMMPPPFPGGCPAFPPGHFMPPGCCACCGPPLMYQTMPFPCGPHMPCGPCVPFGPCGPPPPFGPYGPCGPRPPFGPCMPPPFGPCMPPHSGPCMMPHGPPQAPPGAERAFVNNFKSLVHQSEELMAHLEELGDDSEQFRSLVAESEQVLAELEKQEERHRYQQPPPPMAFVATMPGQCMMPPHMGTMPMQPMFTMPLPQMAQGQPLPQFGGLTGPAGEPLAAYPAMCAGYPTTMPATGAGTPRPPPSVAGGGSGPLPQQLRPPPQADTRAFHPEASGYAPTPGPMPVPPSYIGPMMVPPSAALSASSYAPQIDMYDPDTLYI